MAKVNPRAKEALEMNLHLRGMMSEYAPERGDYIKPSRKVKVGIKDCNGDIKVETKNCNRPCNRCPMRFRCYTEREVTLTEAEWKRVDKTKGTGKTLKQWKERILEEMCYVDVKPYSHNIISLSLQAIARGWGKAKANKTIEEFELETLGWHKED